jgi:hypothetical protein
MAYPKSTIVVARQMRMNGANYDEILTTLKVKSKGTLSKWLGDIPLPAHEDYKRRKADALREYNQTRKAQNQIDQARRIEEGAKEILPLDKVTRFHLFLGLYWGEGYKRDTGVFEFTNSDPRAIRACIDFLKAANVSLQKCQLRLKIHRTTDRGAAISYWTNLTGISRVHVYEVKERPPVPGRTVRILPHGTVAVLLHDAAWARRFHGWLLGVMRQYPE